MGYSNRNGLDEDFEAPADDLEMQVAHCGGHSDHFPDQEYFISGQP
ncbi:hypothetical protein SAMN04488550_3057 [Gordonia malaquae]|nr:hypothetical protein SAMN04488550_3057 [Gordonia malaquae]